MNKDKQSIQELHKQISTLIDIAEKVVTDSKTIPQNLKQAYLGDYKAYKENIGQFREAGNISFMRQLQNELLTLWNETYDEDSQKFWKLVKQNKLPLTQHDYLAKILKRGRIANFGEYNIVQDSLVIWQQDGLITRQQADQLDVMLEQYEQTGSN